MNGWIKLRQLISSTSVGMMTTIGADGSLTARPMLPLLRQGDDAIWFMTESDTAKLRDIADDSRVNLSLIGPDGEYVSISGRATPSRDRAVIDELWHPTYRAWFPGGQEDERLMLVRLVVDHADYWNAPTSRVVRLFGMAKALVTRTPYETAVRERLI